MIADAWPGNTTTRRAVRGDWFALPVRPATVDVVLGDGCFNALEYPRGYWRLARSIADVLRPGGLLVLRLFCRPERSETVDAVIGDLDAGRIESFHILKWRLAMAVQGEDATSGVRLGDLWDVCSARLPSDDALTARTGWPLAHTRTLDGYRGSNGIYTFPRLSEVLATLSGDFERLEQWCGGYQLGERCPHLVFRRLQMP
jgi:SAM-dependent methyltransferase